MRYKPYFVDRYKPKLGFLKKRKKYQRKKRLRLRLGKLKAIRVKTQDSALRKKLGVLIIFFTTLSFIFPPVFYLSIGIIGICFFLACGKALFFKNEKTFSVVKTSDPNNKKGDPKMDRL